MLFLQCDQKDQDPMKERQLRLMLREVEWERQRELWRDSSMNGRRTFACLPGKAPSST